MDMKRGPCTEAREQSALRAMLGLLLQRALLSLLQGRVKMGNMDEDGQYG